MIVRAHNFTEAIYRPPYIYKSDQIELAEYNILNIK